MELIINTSYEKHNLTEIWKTLQNFEELKILYEIP